MSFHYIRKSTEGNNLLRADGFCDALSVQQLMTSAPLPLSVSCELLHYVADILHEAQKHNFVHGDLTLETVCIQGDGSVVINGFGRPRGASFAPEAVPDSSSDVYALGLIMLQMMTPIREISLPFDKGLHNQNLLLDRSKIRHLHQQYLHSYKLIHQHSHIRNQIHMIHYQTY